MRGAPDGADVGTFVAPTTSGLADAAALAEPVPGRYQLGRTLGRGGMGIVVEARDLRTGRSVALKQLAVAPTPGAVAAFVHEARRQGRLDHPAIPPVFDVAIADGGRPYFTMRRIAGMTLSEILARIAAGQDAVAAQWPRERLLRCFVQVCFAIDHAHARGLVHRDLKPSNLMFDVDGDVHILDWGVAAELDGGADQPPPAVAGTLGYAAPEQLVGDVLDGRSDVYALGCVLFEILAAEPLHPPDRALASLLDAADARPSVRRPALAIAPGLDEACVRATAPRAGDRFPRPAALAEAVLAQLDRDDLLRRRVAAERIAAARRALARGADADRVDALVELGSALGWTPDDREARRLAQQIVADPPSTPEAEAVLADADHAAERLLAGRAALTFFSVALLVVLHLAQPRASLAYGAGLFALALGAAGVAFAAARGRGPRAWLWWCLAASAGLIALVARSTGPFLVPVQIAALVVIAAMLHPRLRRPWPVLALALAPILGIRVLEHAGALRSTTSFTGEAIVIESRVSTLSPGLTEASLLILAVAIVALTHWFAPVIADRANAAHRALAAHSRSLARLVTATDEPQDGA